jgi:FlaA1/EpsC-like NDP-sugar epimerase
MPNNIKIGITAKRLALAVLDIISILGAYISTLAFRFGGNIPKFYLDIYANSIWFIILIYLGVFFSFHLYSSLWEHASITELLQIVGAVFFGTIIAAVIARISNLALPASVYIAAGLVLVLMVGWVRMFYRIVRRLRSLEYLSDNTRLKRVMVVGAGNTGATIVKQMFSARNIKKRPVVMVDDDPNKQGLRVHGVAVMGTSEDIPRLAEKYAINEIIYSIPSAPAKVRNRILSICISTGCTLKIVPGIEAVLEGNGLGKMRNVQIEDLLERDEVRLDIDDISAYLKNCIVLVTGGGGSIGSELCRQIAAFSPAKLLIFDIYENNAYELFMDMRRKFGTSLDIEVIIGSVRDPQRLDQVFSQYHPDVVFHAAAHKHVPLMEASPAEAVKNNVFGTFNVAHAAEQYHSKRFVLISTDKAVNPTNIMGATKFLCEQIIHYMNSKNNETRFVAVRFGNVLGSNGSVIPLFRRQIEEGGPVTVTHKEMTRYFMTIPEAARLVIQAGSMAQEGQIFILDMGEPVRIDDFARLYIRLSGYEPDVDIKIEYTGLREGEKMYEELLGSKEEVEPSSFQGIVVCKTWHKDIGAIKQDLDWLRQMVELDDSKVREYIKQVVPTYQDGSSSSQLKDSSTF